MTSIKSTIPLKSSASYCSLVNRSTCTVMAEYGFFCIVGKKDFSMLTGGTVNEKQAEWDKLQLKRNEKLIQSMLQRQSERIILLCPANNWKCDSNNNVLLWTGKENRNYSSTYRTRKHLFLSSIMNKTYKCCRCVNVERNSEKGKRRLIEFRTSH